MLEKRFLFKCDVCGEGGDRWKRVVIIDIIATEFHDSNHEGHADHQLQEYCAEWRSYGTGGVARTEACAAVRTRF
ncbi:MAG: hypothetical protein ACYCUY_10345 [Acidithiobacillus sp.]